MHGRVAARGMVRGRDHPARCSGGVTSDAAAAFRSQDCCSHCPPPSKGGRANLQNPSSAFSCAPCQGCHDVALPAWCSGGESLSKGLAVPLQQPLTTFWHLPRSCSGHSCTAATQVRGKAAATPPAPPRRCRLPPAPLRRGAGRPPDSELRQRQGAQLGAVPQVSVGGDDSGALAESGELRRRGAFGARALGQPQAPRAWLRSTSCGMPHEMHAWLPDGGCLTSCAWRVRLLRQRTSTVLQMTSCSPCQRAAYSISDVVTSGQFCIVPSAMAASAGFSWLACGRSAQPLCGSASRGRSSSASGARSDVDGLLSTAACKQCSRLKINCRQRECASRC